MYGFLWPAGACGLSFLQFCNLNSFRTKFIMGFSLFMGLSVPQYFNEYTSVAGYGPVHTGARWVREMELSSACHSYSALQLRPVITVFHSPLTFWMPRAVQRHDQRALLVEAVRGGAGGVLPGQHDPGARQRREEGQGLPLVGQVPELQDGQPQRGVLLAALQPQQVFPFRLILQGRRIGHRFRGCRLFFAVAGLTGGVREEMILRR